MRKLVSYVVVTGALGLVCGCGAPAKKTSDASDTPSTTEATAADDAAGYGAGDHAEPPPEPEPTSEVPVSLPPPAPEDYEMTQGDCQVLAEHYYGLILREQLAAVPDGLKAGPREQAERQAEQNAQEGRDQWLAQCSTTVGHSYQRQWLDCGMKAREVKRFTDCVTGQVQPAAPPSP